MRPTVAAGSADEPSTVKDAPELVLALPGSVVTVRAARPADLQRTAAIHRRCLPSGFFARSGDRFLARYHATFATGRSAILLVAEEDGTVVGFLAGTFDNAAHYRWLLRGRPLLRLLPVGVAALLRDRRLAAEFVRTRLRRYARAVVRRLPTPRPAGDARAGGAEGTVGVLTHVAVLEEARGTGVGRALVVEFTRAAATAGADELRLVTATDGGAPAFYRRLRWTSRGTRRAADGTFVEEFVRRL